MINRNMKSNNLKMLFLYIIIVTLVGGYVNGNVISMAQDECKKRIVDCATSTSALDKPVCGSDGVTYSSQCQVVLEQCQGKSVLIKHQGPCADIGPCEAVRLTARPGTEPKCRRDGTFEPIQCTAKADYCWCVTPKGQVIDGTAAKNKRPKCMMAMGLVESNPGYSSPSTSTSSSSSSSLSFPVGSGFRNENSNWKQKRQQYTSRHRNTCDRAEKAKFNNNLVENFKIEFRRANISADDKNVERILSWKFMTLDTDGDGHLDRAEYKELRKLAKKNMRPKKCARTFARTCDVNQDLKLSRQEWGACLSNDFILRLFLSLNGAVGRREILQAQKTRAIDQVLKEKPRKDNKFTDFNEDLARKEETDSNDCISDRNSVLEGQEHKKFYVPQCTSDGRYDKVQCYSGYCWCVDQDTGKPIPGTSTKDHQPNCDPVPPPSRPMKGCPESQKEVFLKDLMNLMEMKMKSSADSVETNDKWSSSKEERIATWYFVILDKNKNKVLEKKEWKSFRTMVTNNRHLKRCGKKLPRYCDINNDRRISMTEWLSCLNVQRPTPVIRTPVQTSTSKPRRQGQNPLDQFLNSDD